MPNLTKHVSCTFTLYKVHVYQLSFRYFDNCGSSIRLKKSNVKTICHLHSRCHSGTWTNLMMILCIVDIGKFSAQSMAAWLFLFSLNTFETEKDQVIAFATKVLIQSEIIHTDPYSFDHIWWKIRTVKLYAFWQTVYFRFCGRVGRGFILISGAFGLLSCVVTEKRLN